MELPQPLQSGAPLKTIVPWSKSIVNYLRAITPRSSKTVQVSTLANGTTLTVPAVRTMKASGGTYEDYYAFAAKITAFDPETKKYSIFYRGGSAQVAGGRIAFFDADTVDDVQDDTWCWLERNKNADTWSMEFGDEPPDRGNNNSLPSANEDEDEEDEEEGAGENGGEEQDAGEEGGEGDEEDGGDEEETDIIVPLWHFKYDEDGAGYLTQYSSGAVYMPCVVNVLDVDAQSGNDDGEGGESGGGGGGGGDEEYDPDHPFGPEE